MAGAGEYMVYIQDRKDAGEKRNTSLPAHLAGLQQDPKGFSVLGGFSVVEHGQTPLQITGSSLIVRANSKSEVEARIKNDAFSKDGVWDLETLIILPFISTFREALNH